MEKILEKMVIDNGGCYNLIQDYGITKYLTIENGCLVVRDVEIDGESTMCEYSSLSADDKLEIFNMIGL